MKTGYHLRILHGNGNEQHVDLRIVIRCLERGVDTFPSPVAWKPLDANIELVFGQREQFVDIGLAVDRKPIVLTVANDRDIESLLGRGGRDAAAQNQQRADEEDVSEFHGNAQ